MNLFCFTLEGSTDSLYELPQRSYGMQEFSPVPRRRPCSPKCLVDSSKWGGSEPCIALELPQMPTNQLNKTDLKKAKRKCQKLLVHEPVHLPSNPVSTSDNENTVSSNAYWPCSRKKDESAHSKNHQSEVGVGEEPYISKALGEEEGIETRERAHTVQGVNFEAWNPNREPCESKQHEGGEGEREGEARGTLKKIQKLVRVKKSGQSCTEESRDTSDTSGHLTQTVSKEHSPVITCIGLAKKPEKKLGKEHFQQQQPEPAKEKGLMEMEGPWSPGPFHQTWTIMDASPVWELSYHTCHRPTADQHLYAFNFNVPCGTAWDRFEVHGLDHLKQDQSPDLETTDPLRSSSFGRFESSKHQSPKPEEHEGTSGADGESPEGEPSKGGIGKKMKAISLTMRKKMGRKYVKALSEEMGEDLERDHEGEGEAATSDALAKDCKMSSNSVESLYSLHSGQSTSSGVTSGSDGSSNRDSLRLEEELPYTGQFCGRAKVHTDFVPSPYDTESLKLKVGDVIDIISKPPMGIWTGMLNGKVGNFKFIYVDVLPEEPVPMQRMRTNRKSRRPRPKTLQELLERLNLEDLASSLLLNGYQTVEDLKDLKEQHLIELNVTDPEHRQRLLAATECLQDAELNSQKDGEGEPEPMSPTDPVKVELNDCPRDSGCYIASDCSDNSKEDAENHLPSLEPPPAEV
ncbi:SAM domain-containing protein SAMSN-1b isoform X3 [Pygocentrus nattereri]|uniref:SAM domain-containing protein SAMSN-1b isoform X3 n=1 Tax=Pygocentrus nattereri TaxID=42514 RepID=UPI0008148F2E|nr:SAM domain-containing protein SAMSN-1b isoform X3 [Pygocentrus nattereri]